ncbi:MAG: cell division protein FtsQ/DivIB [Desulfitobacteriaceae bacterium]
MQSRHTNTSLLYFAVLAVMLALGLVVFLRSGAFAIQRVAVSGVRQIPEGEIQRLTGEALGQNLFLFDQDNLARKITLYPIVQTVQFKRQFPHTLAVVVSERTPNALVLVPNGILEVDAQGVFLRRLEGWPQTDYPVITGVEIPDTAGPGDKLAIPALEAGLKVLAQAPSGMLPLISELRVSPIQQITIYLSSGVEVRLGQAQEWKDKLAVLFDLVQNKDYLAFQQGVRYIDFTAATPVIGRN